jgi:hypothetical protein
MTDVLLQYLWLVHAQNVQVAAEAAAAAITEAAAVAAETDTNISVF